MNLHQHWLAALLNHWFGHAVTSTLALVGIHVHNPATPIPAHVATSLLVAVIGILLALLLRARISVDRPGGAQQVAEMLLTNPMGFGIRDLLEENAGHEGTQFVNLVGSVAIFILMANLISVIPAFESPTGNRSVPLACAIIIFAYFNYQGIRHHGPLGYAKHFAGPVWWISPLMFPVEIISTSARLLSLTVRLWANIFASELIYGLFLGLLTALALWSGTQSSVLGVVMLVVPALGPILFIALHVFVSIVQTYVFAILPAIYIGLAVSEEH